MTYGLIQCQRNRNTTTQSSSELTSVIGRWWRRRLSATANQSRHCRRWM